MTFLETTSVFQVSDFLVDLQFFSHADWCLYGTWCHFESRSKISQVFLIRDQKVLQACTDANSLEIIHPHRRWENLHTFKKLIEDHDLQDVLFGQRSSLHSKVNNLPCITHFFFQTKAKRLSFVFFRQLYLRVAYNFYSILLTFDHSLDLRSLVSRRSSLLHISKIFF